MFRGHKFACSVPLTLQALAGLHTRALGPLIEGIARLCPPVDELGCSHPEVIRPELGHSQKLSHQG